MRAIIVSALLGLSCVLCPTAQARSYPRLASHSNRPECTAALHLAQLAFDSTNARLSVPLSMPDGFKYTPATPDNDPHHFVSVHDTDHNDIYWGRDISNGARIVEVASPVGWRGDLYSLYILDPKVSQDAFLKDEESNAGAHIHASAIGQGWQQPLVFWNRDDDTAWFLSVNGFAEVQGDWSVTVPNRQHSKLDGLCIVQFRPGPESDSNAFDLLHVAAPLPKAVLRLVELLDQTIGSGRGEGTLQPTATLRIQVKRVWANVANRPWALSGNDGYNSRDTVDSELKAWSRNGPSFANVYRKIQKDYPIAQRALSRYYHRRFGVPRVKADSFAKWALDVAYRSNYVFPGGSRAASPPPSLWGSKRSGNQ